MKKSSTRVYTAKEIKDMDIGIYLTHVFGAYKNNKKDGPLTIWFGKNPIPLWERTHQKRDHHHNQWKTKVFERDKFTCQKCNQVGRELNAHHIKSYKDYPKQRFKTNNGITLCVQCHRFVHKNKVDFKQHKLISTSL